MNKVSQAEAKPSKFIKDITSSTKLKLLHIKAIDSNSTNSPQTLSSAQIEDVKVGTTQEEMKETGPTSVHRSPSCSQVSPTQTTPTAEVPEDAMDDCILWKTCAVVIDRVFFLVHLALQITVILTVYFKL